jgi:hypothetical protein
MVDYHTHTEGDGTNGAADDLMQEFHALSEWAGTLLAKFWDPGRGPAHRRRLDRGFFQVAGTPVQTVPRVHRRGAPLCRL